MCKNSKKLFRKIELNLFLIRFIYLFLLLIFLNRVYSDAVTSTRYRESAKYCIEGHTIHYLKDVDRWQSRRRQKQSSNCFKKILKYSSFYLVFFLYFWFSHFVLLAMSCSKSSCCYGPDIFFITYVENIYS